MFDHVCRVVLAGWTLAQCNWWLASYFPRQGMKKFWQFFPLVNGQTRLQNTPQQCQVRRVISFSESLLSQVMLQIGVLKALHWRVSVPSCGWVGNGKCQRRVISEMVGRPAQQLQVLAHSDTTLDLLSTVFTSWPTRKRLVWAKEVSWASETVIPLTCVCCPSKANSYPVTLFDRPALLHLAKVEGCDVCKILSNKQTKPPTHPKVSPWNMGLIRA